MPFGQDVSENTMRGFLSFAVVGLTIAAGFMYAVGSIALSGM